MTHYPYARRNLGDELATERGHAYASVLGVMTGISLRADTFSGARQKTFRSEVNGMRRALRLILRAEFDLSEEDAEKIVKADEQRWREATAEDEAALDTAR